MKWQILDLLTKVVISVTNGTKSIKIDKEESAAVAKILKGNPKYLGASLAQGHAHFSSLMLTNRSQN